MTDLPPFPDLEAAVIELLADLSSGNVDVTTPPNLQDVCPFIRVTRNGGDDDRITDSGHIDVDVFALKRTDAQALAGTVRQRMISWPHSLSNCVIDRADCTGGPTAVPWADPVVSLVTLAFLVTARRTFASV